jgi:LmbE family N-acetylglucosaminyl deacetylase
MSERVLVIAPHPDDETLGCGGTLLRMRSEGAQLGWLIVTGISESTGWPAERVRQRDAEIEQVARLIGFSEVFNLRLPTTRLDTLPMGELVAQFSAVFKSFAPQQVFLPHWSDVHTDHRVVFDAGAACAKWFRYPSVRRVLAYETLSETEFALGSGAFQPNYFVDIGNFLDGKLACMDVYRSESGPFPFPRSVEAIRALATLRGATAGFGAAEAFQLLRERSALTTDGN